MLIDFQPLDRRRSLALSAAKARDIAKASLLVSALWVAEITSQPAAAGWRPQIANARTPSTTIFAARSMLSPNDRSGPAIGLVLPVQQGAGNQLVEHNLWRIDRRCNEATPRCDTSS